MEAGSSPLDGIRRIFGFPDPGRQKQRGNREAFEKELAKGQDERDPSEPPEELVMEQGASGGRSTRHVFEDPRKIKKQPRGRSDDGKGLKVDLLA